MKYIKEYDLITEKNGKQEDIAKQILTIIETSPERVTEIVYGHSEDRKRHESTFTIDNTNVIVSCEHNSSILKYEYGQYKHKLQVDNTLLDVSFSICKKIIEVIKKIKPETTQSDRYDTFRNTFNVPYKTTKMEKEIEQKITSFYK